MIGYIYKTTNLKNGKVYIGKHLATKHEPSYLGSGEILLKAVKLYGKQNFINEIIATAKSIEELDELEKFYIKQYKSQNEIGCYNLAEGGEGGNVFKYASEEKYNKFVEKMTKINQERCRTEQFKQQTSQRMKKLYENPDERVKQSLKIRTAWSDTKLRAEQSARVTEWHKTHKINREFQSHKCYTIFQGHVEQFDSEKECIDYLKKTYNFVPSDLKKCNPYKAFHKKRRYLDGLIFGYGTFQRKSVTTNCDECNSVGAEIGTASKCETACNVEEIV